MGIGSPETIKGPDIFRDELLETVNRLKFTYGEEFEYNGTNFLLILTDVTSPSDNHSPAVFHQSTAINGYDIYLLETLSDNEKKRAVFHEALEANLRDQGFENHQSHELTLEEEEKVFGKRK